MSWDASAYHSEYRKKMVAKGLCGACFKNPSRPNRTTCQQCFDKQHSRVMNRTPKQRAKIRRRNTERRRQLRAEREAAGLCVDCGAEKPKPERKRCLACLKFGRHYAQKYRIQRREWFRRWRPKIRAERLAAGLCQDCGKEPLLPGIKVGVKCKVIHNRATAKWRAVNRPVRRPKKAPKLTAAYARLMREADEMVERRFGAVA